MLGLSGTCLRLRGTSGAHPPPGPPDDATAQKRNASPQKVRVPLNVAAAPVPRGAALVRAPSFRRVPSLAATCGGARAALRCRAPWRQRAWKGQTERRGPRRRPLAPLRRR